MKNLYEINTPVWLDRLSNKYNQSITLGTIPDEELENLANFNIDSVWLMGVWQRSEAAAEISRSDTPLVDEIKSILPDFTTKDIIGSAYAIKQYDADERFGGNAELAIFRKQLTNHGLKLILDFVPNHTAFDSPWLSTNPEFYITTNQVNAEKKPGKFKFINDKMVAYGADPSFDPWPDVAQMNAFSPQYRTICIDTLKKISTMCDGVRCDMAMLMINDIFAKSWYEFCDEIPTSEYWSEIISAVKNNQSDFVFVAETYWQTEHKLVELGFNYCYDKTSYDYMVARDQDRLREHLENYSAIGNNLVHFLENHDEPRAAALFSPQESIEYAKIISRLPGLHLWHDGQFEGYTIKLPVHIRRGPQEEVDQNLLYSYKEIFRS